MTERPPSTPSAKQPCPGRLALCGVPCGCEGSNPSHYPASPRPTDSAQTSAEDTDV